MFKRLERTISYYMAIFLPLLFCVGRFIPYVETFATLFSIIVLVFNQINKKRHFMLRILIVILFIISGFMGVKYSMHVEHIKPLIIMFLAMDAVESDLYENIMKTIIRHKKFLMQQLIFILFANIAFMFLDAGYSSAYQKAWSISAYQGIFSDPHQCAYHICALIILVLLIAKDDYKPYQFWVLCGFEYCVLLTGARAPTLVALVLGLIFVIDHVVKLEASTDYRKKILKFFALFIVIGIASFFMLKYTNFGIKMINSILSENVDNGRAVLRERDWMLFLNSDIIHKLFGYGTDAIIEYHGSFKYAATIWSHNDFFQILVGMGAILFIIYVSFWMNRLIKAAKTSFLYLIVVITLIFVAFYNGVYIHTRFTFLMPLLFIYMDNRTSILKHTTE